MQTMYMDPGHNQPGQAFNPASNFGLDSRSAQPQMPFIQHQQTMGGSQKLPPNIQLLINRICENLNTSGKTVEDAFRGVPVENISGVAAYRTRDFTSQCERMFHLNSSEAFSVATYFFINRPQQDHVDLAEFTALINFEKSKYDAILRTYEVELRALRTSLSQRHAGVHKWFKSYVKNTNMVDNSLEFAEFSKSVKDLNCFQVTDQAIQGIFHGLDQARVGRVLVSDVESMFKIHQRKANPHVRPDEVLASILRAFNCDLQYIHDELRSISYQNSHVLSQEDAIRFFEKFPGYQSFYHEDELSVVLDTFVKESGRVDLPELYETMQRVLRYNNPQLQPNPNQQGIHKQGMAGASGAVAGGESWSPLKSFSTFSVDGTSALARAAQIIRPQVLPEIEDRKIEDLQKACFVRARTVLQYFEEAKGATRDGSLSKTVFQNTIQDLQLTWSSMEIDKFFQQICQTQGNGRFDEVRANSIDEVVHFLCKKTLAQMHAELLYQIFQKSTTGGLPPLQQVFEDHIARAGGGYYQQSFSRTCTLLQLDEVLRNYQVYLNRIDLTYLASQYIVSGRQEDIQYQKLIDDVRNAQRAAAGENFSQVDPKSTCSSIIKQMHIFDLQIQQYLASNAGRGGFFTEAEFINLLGSNLQLCPEVCTEQQLRNLYSYVDQRRTNSVSQQDLVRYIQSNANSVEKLKIDLQKQLADQDIDKRFMNHHSFIQDGVNFPIPEFMSILERLFISKIDAKFLVKFYQDYRQQFVNAHNFVQETMRQKISSASIAGMPASGQIGGVPQANEREAREALRAISSMSEALRIQFQSKLGRMMKGNQTSFINTAEIKRSLDEFMPSLPQHLEMALLLKYMKPEDKNQFNFQAFQSDLQQIVGLSDSKIPTLDEPTRRLYALVKQYLTDGEVQVRFVINLKTIDSLEHGYLNEAMILQAFENTYLEMRQGSRVPRLSPQEFQKLLRPISRNSNGFYNYREILVQIFGLEQGDKYFLMDRQQLETETGTAFGSRSNRYVLPQQIINPKNNSLGGIGTKVIQSNGNIEETIKLVLGARTDNKMTFDQIMTVLQQLNVNLTPDERNVLIQWSRQSQDAQSLVSALQFLNDIGLPPQTLIARDRKKPPVKELRNEELVEAQKLINMISEELRSQNKRPEDVIEKHRMNRTEMGMKPATFMKALQAEVPRLMQRLDKSKVSLLVHYLVQEECGQVSFNKLLRALNLTIRDPPLRQDQIEQIREHKQVIERALTMTTLPIEVTHLLHFMSQNSLSIPTMFKIVSQRQLTQESVIDQRTFDECCSENRYEPKDRDRLIQALSVQGPRGASSISLYKLQSFKKEWDKKNQGARGTSNANNQNYGRFDQTVKVKLEKISQWMQGNSYTTAQLYDMLDGNKDGNVDKHEFVLGLTSLRIPGFIQKDYVTIFEAIDTDNNMYLSLNEFGLFLEGVKKSREQRLNELPQEITRDIQNQIRDLFNVFDSDNSGTIDRNEIMKTFQGLGYEIDIEKADAMIKKVDTSGKGQITLQEFTALIMPEMQQRLLEQDDRIEDFRAMFKDADTDYSGFLTVDEVYTVLLKKGIDLSHEELCELIAEFDVSGDGKLDIDEFVAMMNISSDMVFNSSNAKATYLKIRQSSRLNVIDFMKAFKTLPSAFIPSVFTSKWVKESKLRPSEVLKAQLDPRTMTWKDMLPVLNEELTPEMQQPANRPKIRPIQTQYGCEIQIESAEGIPLPTNSSEFDRSMIVKRAVRIGIFDSKKRDFIANAVQVEATWQASAEDKWVFPKTNVSLNPVLFRSTKKDDLALDGIQFVFEFVIYYKKGNQNLELSSGWAKTDDLNVANRSLNNFKLKIQGGSPTTSILIEDSDVNTKRTGIAGLLKAFSSKITTQLIVSFKPHTQLEPETKIHMQFLPSTCLIQKRILLFVSGYRNYAGQSLLKESSLGNFKQPGGNACLASFPKIIDNIDILETVAAVWSEDVIAAMSAPQKKSIEHPMKKAKEIIYKIYPVLYADEFQLNESNYMNSACFDQNRYQMRVDLLLSALRFGGPPKGGKPAPKKPIEELTTFKPFNVRETMWEVWDIKEGKYEQYLNLHQQRGMFADSAVVSQHHQNDAAPAGFMPGVQGRDQMDLMSGAQGRGRNNAIVGGASAAMAAPNVGPANPNANIALRPRNPAPPRRNI